MRYHFSDFVLDSDRRELAHGREAIEIGPQVFDLLLHLVRNRERVVTKDNLIEVVWSGRIVSESTLTSHINAVRKAIRDTGEEKRLVRTIARKGYRFVGEVRENPAPKGPDAAKAEETGLSVLDRPSIAVLPFVNLSGDPAQDYFVDGMTEELITDLAKVSTLRVISRTSVMRYKGTRKGLPDIARELNVDGIVEGSVMRSGNRVRVTAQLLSAPSDRHL